MAMRALLAAMAVAAAGGALAEPQRSEARLLAGWAEGSGERVAGLWVGLAPGWKTYWRAPGEAGIPPVFDWSGSTNLAEVAVEWPAPHAFDSFGMTTLGYAGEVTLPLRLRAADPAQPVVLRLGFDYGVCADICVPERADLTLTIAPDADPASPAPIAAALAAAPVAAAAVGAHAVCAVRGAGAERRFEAQLTLRDPLTAAPVVVVEGPPEVWFASADSSLSADGAGVGVGAEVFLADPGAWVARDALRLTMITPQGAVAFEGCAAP